MRLLTVFALILAAATAQAESAYRLVVVPAAGDKTDFDKETLESITQTLYVAAAAGLGPRNWKIAPEESVNTFFRDLDHRRDNCGFQCVQALGRYFEATVVVTTNLTRSPEGGYSAFIRAQVPAAGRELTAARVEAKDMRELRQGIEEKAVPIFETLAGVKPEDPHGPFWWVAVRGQLISPSGLVGGELDVKVWKLALGLSYGLRSGAAVSFLPLDMSGGPFFRVGFSSNKLRDLPAADQENTLGMSAGYDFRLFKDRVSVCAGLGSERYWPAEGGVGYRPVADVRVGWVFF